jgi:hypothetical protein
MRFPTLKECASADGIVQTLLREFEERVQNEYVALLAHAQNHRIAPQAITLLATSVVTSLAARIAVETRIHTGDDVQHKAFLNLASDCICWALIRSDKKQLDLRKGKQKERSTKHHQPRNLLAEGHN